MVGYMILQLFSGVISCICFVFQLSQMYLVQKIEFSNLQPSILEGFCPLF